MLMKWIFAAFALLAVSPLLAQHTYVMPHFTERQGDWSTELSLVNATGAATHVTFAAYGNDGTLLAEHQQWLAPQRSLNQSLPTLFPNLSQDRGWIQIESSIAELAGLMTFTSLHGGGTASLPLGETAAPDLLFPLLEHHGARQSGLVLTNPGATAAIVTLRLIDPNGTVTTQTLSLAARAKWVGMLADLVPRATPAHVSVAVSADQPLLGFALTFQDAVSQIFAVPATAIDNRAEHNWRQLVQQQYDACSVQTGLMAGYQVGDGAPVIAAAGMVDVDTGEAARPDTIAEIGSVTKGFVAAVLLLLQEEGRIDLDAPVANFLDGIPGGDVITTRMLLNHTSGLPEYTNKAAFFEAVVAAYDGEPMWSVDQILEFALAQEINFAPGADWSYCNTGYLMAGKIAEQVGGQTLAQLIRQRILEPLGMRDTYLGGYETLPERATPYFWVEEDQMLVDMAPIGLHWAGAAGGLVSTNQDLMRWAKGLFEGDLLQPDSLAEMLTAAPQSGDDGYGLGMGVGEINGVTVYSHTGQTFGGSAYLLYLPHAKATFTMTANIGQFDQAFFDLVNMAMAPYLSDATKNAESDVTAYYLKNYEPNLPILLR